MANGRGLARLQVRILGIVQGVGFRPFIYRLATDLGLKGWVRNDGEGVTIEVEGPHDLLLTFLERIPKEKPPPAFIYTLDHRFLPPAGYSTFEIRKSASQGPPKVWILPDLATCEACQKELLDPSDRRYLYPFINCTHCGPRFTIIEELPYDRPRTSMKRFLMCEDCRREYEDPKDRRFHAQPNACPVCGPHVELWHKDGTVIARRHEAIVGAVKALQEGQIVAVKGLGGFHLMVDATQEPGVAELRRRKRRPFKAFAVMYPGITSLRRHVHVPPYAESLLRSPQAPILLLPRTQAGWEEIAPSVAPKSPYLGVFLPYTPLHMILLAELDQPVVATSGNLTDEPIVTDEKEALEKLGTLADVFLVHNRPIVRHADDSVLHFLLKPEVKPQMLRRARGYTPLPVLAPRRLPPIVALGGHLNVTLAVTRDREIILSQHLGDMETFEARKTYRKTLEDFLRLFEIRPELVAHDLHPAYFTSQVAQEFDLPRIAVQHHHAHLAACMLENELSGETLGLTWDGTGYGPDETVWGGEFLLGDPASYQRVATLWPFRLPGGERAIKEPWRTALSLLYEAFEGEVPTDLPLFEEIPAEKIARIVQLLQKGVRSPITTSMGRLFDGVSAILGISYWNTHQAQSAQLLEYAAWEHPEAALELPLPLRDTDPIRLDWRPMVRAVVEDLRKGTPVEVLASAFHHALVRASLEVARRIQCSQVVLAGGVFCNRFLTEGILETFWPEGFRVFVHSQLPPTDGSLAAGQAWVAAHQKEMSSH